ncbi:MAG: RIP metalloprotease RseP [Alphaproteobacteria bacterium]|nr:RIP metalloprotease RseP [Alphaproteobacteria bacterium]
MQEILSFIEYTAAFIVVLSIVVFVHEMGHFLVARMCGVRVLEFSIGFGKKLWSRQDKKGTYWSLRAVPLGGFVQMFGDADAASAKADESVKEFTEEEKKVSFPFQPVWKKIAIIFAGPATNYIFAILLMAGVFMVYGQIKVAPIVGSVMEKSPAAAAGIIANDKILEINGEKISEFSDIKRWIVLAPEANLKMRVERDGKILNLEAKLAEKPEDRVLGVQSKTIAPGDVSSMSLPSALYESSLLAWKMTADTMIYLKQVFTSSRSPDEMRGPLGIAEASGDAAKGGFLNFLVFLVQISIGIGLINLFPIPLLDGGQIIVYLIEALRGKPLNEKIMEKALMVGMGLLIGILLLTLWNDIPRIFNRLVG